MITKSSGVKNTKSLAVHQKVSSESDKIFLVSIKKEIEELEKELNHRSEPDDLIISSESEERKSSQEISLSSEFSLSEPVSLPESSTPRLASKVKKPFSSLKSHSNSKKNNEASKIKELENRIKELEAKSVEDKKQCSRVQEINKSLVKKVKDLESELQRVSDKQGKYKKHNKEIKDQSKKICEENIELQQRLNDAQHLIAVINNKYDTLVETSLQFECKTRDLFRMNDLLKDLLTKAVQPQT